VASSASTGAQPATLTTSAIPPGQSVRGDGDADNPSDIDGNGDNDLKTTSVDHATSDGDNDNPTPASYRYPDLDDHAVLSYGEAPSVLVSRKIAGLIRAYYRAAADADGSTACVLIVPSVARSVPEDYGSGAGPSYLRGGKTCAAVMTMLFKHDHPELSTPPKLMSIRVKGDEGQVVLASRVLSANLLYLRRQAGLWRVEELLGEPLP
jgi:hypothetical protein